MKQVKRLAAAMLMLAVLAPATPVAAEAWGDSGGIGIPGGDGQYRDGNIYCRNGEGWIRPNDGSPHYKFYDYPFSQCPASQTGGVPVCPTEDCRLLYTEESQYYSYEPTHIEVWRFYGTRENPVMFWSASRVNLSAWGSDNAPLVLFAPHPNDAAGAQRNGFVSPYQGLSATNSSNETVVYTPSTSEVLGFAHTTLPPFRTSPGSCQSLISSDNPYRSLPAWAQERLAARYNEWAARFSPATGLALSNLRSMSPMQFDDSIPCGSGVEFSRPDRVLEENPALQPVYGTCWIPVERRATTFTSGSTGIPVFNWRTSGGHRYDMTKYAMNSTTTVDPTTGGAPAYHAVWRAAIADEVRTRQAPDLTPTNGSGSGNFTPGDPYNKAYPDLDYNAFRLTSNRERAAWAAGLFAHCEDGPSLAEPPQMSDPIVAGDATVTVTVNAQNVFMVTPVGNAAPQRVTARSHSFVCSGNCQDPELPSPYVLEVNNQVKVAGTAGYDGFQITDRSSTGRYGSTSYADLYFSKPTTPSQKVQVFAEASGSWRLFTEKVTVTTPACSTCAPEDTITIEYFVWEDKPLGIIYELSPSLRPVYGATAVWRN